MKYKTLIGVGLTVICAVSVVMTLGLFRGIEYSLSDQLFSPKMVDPRIIIVGIDETTLGKLGQWPLPRNVLATGLQNIIDARPKGIGIDIIFADPSRLGLDDDKALEQVFKGSPVPITLPVEALSLTIKDAVIPRADEVLSTLPQFSGDAIIFGHINLIKDRDGIVRRFPRAIINGENAIPNFSAQVVGKTGSHEIERIVWSGNPGTVRHISFGDVVLGNIDPNIFKGTYVFIGATASDLHDEQTTPVSAGTAMSGVEIQAQIGSMLLSDFTLKDIPMSLFVTWLLFAILIPLFTFFYAKNIATAIFVTLGLFLLNLIFITTLFEIGILVDIVYTSLAVLLSGSTSFSVRYFILERERREIRTVFSKYVSKAVLEELLKNPQAVTLGGAEASVTIFFSDIRGFTSLSEKLTPKELTTLLNRYLTRMTDIILNDDGVVDKYIGDAIMAFWGAPLKDPLHAYHAIKSALTMLKELDSFNEESEKMGDPLITIGIGLNTGDVIIGNMGSTQRFDYTIMGDAVNLGSRIEGQTKTYGVRLLASEMTITALKSTHTEDDTIMIREIDKVTVKGKTEPVALFEIVEFSHQDFVRSILKDFDILREHYYAGSWKHAKEVAEKILATGNDGPTRVLLARSISFLENPPTAWNGVYELTIK